MARARMDRIFDRSLHDGRRRGRRSFLALLAMALVIAGAINWGLVGLAGYDFIADVLGEGTRLAKIAYALVGVAGLYCVFLLPRATRNG